MGRTFAVVLESVNGTNPTAEDMRDALNFWLGDVDELQHDDVRDVQARVIECRRVD